MNQDTLKFATNMDNHVTLLFDTPQTGTNSYGEWFRYGCEHDGEEKSFFATGFLRSKLEGYGKGAKLNIRKEEVSGGKVGWNVIPAEGTAIKTTKDVPAMRQQRQVTHDDRTLDIHKQVCLTLAIESMGIVESLDIAEVTRRMKALQLILDGEVDTPEGKNQANGDDELPF